jgi:hypothetical protein
VVLAVTVPVEVVLLDALTLSSSQEAADQWVAGLSSDELDAAADTIQSYPVAYRREILRALPAEKRSDVWRNHIRAYMASGRDLSSDAVPVLEGAIAVASPEVFAEVTDANRQKLLLVAEQVVGAVGRDDAEYLLYRLGPKDGTFASVEPLRHRLANLVRSYVAFARATTCDCNMMWGCEEFTSCTQDIWCREDYDWPACGWWLYEVCDGLCVTG